MKSEGDFSRSKELHFSYKQKSFPPKKVIAVLFGVIAISLLFWYAPLIMSYIQIPSSQTNDSLPEYFYTNITLRDNIRVSELDEQIIEFGDTVYSLWYSGGYLRVHAPFQSEDYIPKEGKTYSDLGLEIKVSKVSSDYLSNYIEIKVRPTVENFMFSTYYYTKIDIPLENMRSVNISSGLINRTNEYIFSYTEPPSMGYGATLVVRNETQRGIYQAYVNFLVPEAKDDFDLELRVYKADSENMIIYVKPLY